MRIIALGLALALLPASAQAQREEGRTGGYSGPADDEISAWTRCIGASISAAPLAADAASADIPRVVEAAYAACTERRQVMEEAINADPDNRYTFYAADVIAMLDEIVRPAVADFYMARLREAAAAEGAPAAE